MTKNLISNFIFSITSVLAMCSWDLKHDINPEIHVCDASTYSVTEMPNSIFRIKLATGSSRDCMYLFLPLSSDSTSNQP